MGYKDREQQRLYQREWKLCRRREFFLGKVCTRCRATDTLELHHKDRTQKIASSIWSWSADRREREIAKCEVLCRRCHKEETRKQISFHGFSKYSHGGCRCAVCTAANLEHRKKYRQTTR